LQDIQLNIRMMAYRFDFAYVRADACSASADLVGNDRFVLGFKVFDEVYDFNGEVH